MLTAYQKELVTKHLPLVEKIIRSRIRLAGNHLLQYDDLYQTGCEALCRAAMKYDPAVSDTFEPLAARCIRNALLDFCRSHNRMAGRTADWNLETDLIPAYMLGKTCDNACDKAYENEVRAMLKQCREKYTGVAQKGIEAMELKMLGYPTGEIAGQYGTSINNVNAWISRARSKLKKEPAFAELF